VTSDLLQVAIKANRGPKKVMSFSENRELRVLAQPWFRVSPVLPVQP